MSRVCTLALSFALCAPCANVPQRIVSLSPDLTEVLYGLGAFPRVVGVSDYDTYPPEVAKTIDPDRYPSLPALLSDACRRHAASGRTVSVTVGSPLERWGQRAGRALP